MPSANPKRVAVVYMLTHPGGVQSCALALIRGLNERGIVPDVLWDQPPSQPLLEEANARAGYGRLPFPIPSRFIVRLPMTLRYLAWIANVVSGEAWRDKYDCFYSFYNGFLTPEGVPHVYYLSGPPLLPQLQLPKSGVRGLPFRCARATYVKSLRIRWPAYDYHRSRNYVINSRYTADLFYEAHGVRLPVVYPAINLSGRDFDPGDLPRRDTLLFFSRIVDYKRPEMVLDLARQFPGFRCVIMGGVTPNRQTYFNSLRRRGGNAVFIPNPSDAQVREELGRARFYVFPAVNEHFGMTTPEAMASGAIPFVHNSGGQREIVPDERLRFDDPELLAKFGRLSSLSHAELNMLRAELKEHVRQYSAETYVSRLQAAVANLRND
jgi:glycosyltransferase involved in cell wall biosynthesis